MTETDQQKAETPVEETPRECSRCGCAHMSFVSRQGRFGKTVLERFACRNCGRVNSFATKKTDAA